MITRVPDEVVPGYYRHYLGGLYFVEGVARNANVPEERSVVYWPHGVHEGKLPMRTYRRVDGDGGFFTPVIIDGQERERFTLLYRANGTRVAQEDA